MSSMQQFEVNNKHKGISCIPHPNYIHQEINDEDIPSKKDFNFGQALADVYPLLDIVFEYLPTKDLKNCAEVCKSWENVANDLVAKRISKFTKPMVVTCSSTCLIRTTNLPFSQFEFALMFCNRKINGRRKICYHSADKTKHISLSEYLSDNFSPEEYVIVTEQKIYFSPDTSNKVVVFAGVLIPKVPGVRICTFQSTADNNALTSEKLNENEKVAGLLLFSTNISGGIQHLLEAIVDNVRSKCKENVAFGGGIIWSVISPLNASRNKKESFNAIAFVHDESSDTQFSAISIVINDLECCSERLLKLKEEFPLKCNSFAVMIICCGRTKKNESIRNFREHFPNVPLLGIESSGEYGWDSKNNCRQYGVTWNPDILHSYCISLIMFTWGNAGK